MTWTKLVPTVINRWYWIKDKDVKFAAFLYETADHQPWHFGMIYNEAIPLSILQKPGVYVWDVPIEEPQ